MWSEDMRIRAGKEAAEEVKEGTEGGGAVMKAEGPADFRFVIFCG